MMYTNTLIIQMTFFCAVFFRKHVNILVKNKKSARGRGAFGSTTPPSHPIPSHPRQFVARPNQVNFFLTISPPRILFEIAQRKLHVLCESAKLICFTMFLDLNVGIFLQKIQEDVPQRAFEPLLAPMLWLVVEPWLALILWFMF